MEHLGKNSTNSGPPFGKELPPPANLEGHVTQVATELSDGVIETTGTAVRVTKFDVAHYLHKNLILKLNQICKPEILLHNKIDGHAPCIVQFLREYGSKHARRTLSVIATTASSRFEKNKAAPSPNFLRSR